MVRTTLRCLPFRLRRFAIDGVGLVGLLVLSLIIIPRLGLSAGGVVGIVAVLVIASAVALEQGPQRKD